MTERVAMGDANGEALLGHRVLSPRQRPAWDARKMSLTPALGRVVFVSDTGSIPALRSWR